MTAPGPEPDGHSPAIGSHHKQVLLVGPGPDAEVAMALSSTTMESRGREPAGAFTPWATRAPATGLPRLDI